MATTHIKVWHSSSEEEAFITLDHLDEIPSRVICRAASLMTKYIVDTVDKLPKQTPERRFYKAHTLEELLIIVGAERLHKKIRKTERKRVLKKVLFTIPNNITYWESSNYDGNVRIFFAPNDKNNLYDYFALGTMITLYMRGYEIFESKAHSLFVFNNFGHLYIDENRKVWEVAYLTSETIETVLI